jgi:hypothetical protein
MRRIDVHAGALGLSLLTCAALFAALGTPPLPPAPMVVLGVPSPLTGMTRSFVAVAEGRLTDAFVLHPLGPLCFAACALAAVSLTVTAARGRRPAAVERIVALPHRGVIVAASFLAAWVRQIVVFG